MKTIYLSQRLSPRLTQVLQLLGRGLADQEAAERLGITLGTLGSNHLPHLRIALHVSTLEEVRRVARDWGGISVFSPRSLEDG
jgi:DNA-binding NarL/FixJ family response regulator